MIIMYYIIIFIQTDKAIANLPLGASGVVMVLELGGWVVAFFSLLFLFYTNSFLMRRRKKEFGLYNILGMGKFNLARIIFWETVIIAVISLVTESIKCRYQLHRINIYAGSFYDSCGIRSNLFDTPSEFHKADKVFNGNVAFEIGEYRRKAAKSKLVLGSIRRDNSCGCLLYRDNR